MLTLAYLLPVLLVSLVLIKAQLPQWQKASLLAALPLFYGLHYHGISNLSGWPTSESLPERFLLLGQKVVQPDKRDGSPGHINLWIQIGDDPRSRLYELPYSRELHEKLVLAESRAAQGRQQMGIRRTTGEGSQPHADSDRGQIEFTDRPRNRPPEKDGD